MTDYSDTTKPTTTYTDTNIVATAFSEVTKSSTPMNDTSKNNTHYATNPDAEDGVLLNSSTVTLNSITVKLTGYTGDVPHTTNKPSTAYGDV